MAIGDIAEYVVVMSYELKSLERQVNKNISKGWQPHGNMSIDTRGNSTYYYQPMIKRKEPPVLNNYEASYEPN